MSRLQSPRNRDTSRRSSVTFLGQPGVHGGGLPHSPLDDEIMHIESNFEMYGGDDIHDPDPRPIHRQRLSTVPSEFEWSPSTHVVSWDTGAMSNLPNRKNLSRNPSMTFLGPSGALEINFPRVPLDDEILRIDPNFESVENIHDVEPKLLSPNRKRLSTVPSQKGSSPGPNMITWDGPDDPTNPQNWTIRRKWIITMVCVIMTVNVTFASSAPTSAVKEIIDQFHISREVSDLLTTMFLLGYVFGPLFWGPGSELVGRQPIFRVTMIVYTLLFLGQALAPNIESLLITRFLSGFFAVAPLTNCGGVIADIWPAVGRGPATSLFTASVFLGPVLGPIVAGYIIESSLSWRWVFWVMMIFAGACTLIMVLTLPETYAPVLLLKKVKKLRKEDPEGSVGVYAEHEKQDWSAKGVIHRTIYRPFFMLSREPILVLVTAYLSLVYGILYALFQAFPIIFIQGRGFTIAQDGLVFIGIGIGTSIGAAINVWTTRNYPELIAKWKGFPPPEYRLVGAMIGAPSFVIGSFWLGWTGQYSNIPWYVPGLSTILIGIGISMIFISFLSYLVDTYLMYSASAFAANTMIRSAVAASFPLFTVQMFTKLGINWACTLLALIALLLAPSPFLFWKYGARIRENSTFAPCIDLKIAKALKAEAEAEATMSQKV